ncbi:MAG: hypothetical protein ACRETD_04950 [Steroidobacteraceae bacterium]
MPQNPVFAARTAHDPELDMHRAGPLYRGRLRRLFTNLLGYRSGLPMGTPRRSIDREQQQYSPPCD